MRILQIKELDAQELRYIELLGQQLDVAKKAVSGAEKAIHENFQNLRKKYFSELKELPKGIMGAIPTLEIHGNHLVVVRHDY